MSEIIIRKARPEDAAELANVHINSWRETYVGLIPQDFLDNRPLSFRNRHQLWTRVTSDPTQITFVAECPENGVIGFVNGKNARDQEYSDHAEVWAIYLFRKYQGKKIGHKLLKEFFNHYKSQGFKKAYLWVVKDNPTINFYERTGGVFNNHTKEEMIGGQKITELCYVWDNLDL
jgi:ribosomal protein S18 acetylase RimI-like enzyme